MPYAAFQASHIYGTTVASINVLDASGELLEATPVQEYRPSITASGTGSADLLRPYRGYAAALDTVGTGSVAATPHKRLRFGMTVNVGSVPSAEDVAQAVWAFTQRQLTGIVDANIKKVNDVTVNGTGATGNEWGP